MTTNITPQRPAGEQVPLLQLENVSKTFVPAGGMRSKRQQREPVRALDDVSLTVAQHETVALVGESGSGKSTLARVAMRLLTPDSGLVLLDGQDLLGMDRASLIAARRRIQMVFQDPYSSLNPQRTVGYAIAEPARVNRLVSSSEQAGYVEELLDRVGLPARLASRLPRELSGGQRQRVAIARALAVKPGMLVADEAVSALDVSVQAQILNLFETLREELDLTMLFISHQLPVVAHVADRVAVMYLGRIVEIGTPEDLFAHPAHPYTAGLIEAQPGRHRRKSKPATRRHRDISPSELFERGCSYRDRCQLAVQQCHEIQPPMVSVAAGQHAACHRAREISSSQPEVASATTPCGGGCVSAQARVLDWWRGILCSSVGL
jgi:oligopeptide/dipeptide ABC transporter ATP-binding protein